MRATENFDDLRKLTFTELHLKYHIDEGNIVQEFNDKVNELKKKPFPDYKKSGLRSFYHEMNVFLHGFEGYQRAFFEKFSTRDDNDDSKDTIDKFLRSSEIYFNRADTIINQISNAIAKKETKEAIYWAVVGILLASFFFIFSYIKPPEPTSAQLFEKKFEIDSVALVITQRENDFLKEEYKALSGKIKNSEKPDKVRSVK